MNYITKSLYLLPLLGFFTAGCSSSSNLQTSETDDVYFSSKDKVTYVEPVYSAQQSDTSSPNSSGDITARESDPETYDNSSKSRRSNNEPYQYSFYDAPFGNPYYAYRNPFYYPGRYYSRAIMMDPWYDPWFDPFMGPGLAVYDPFWPSPYGGISIAIGYGWGRMYDPWGWGYGYGGYYNPYRYGYYDGYYGRGVVARKVAYGPRHDRSSNTAARSSQNMSRGTRGGATSSSSARVSNAQTGEVNRSRTASGQAYPGNTADETETQRTRSRRSRTSSENGEEIMQMPTPTNSDTRSSSSEAQPTRRRREAPNPAPAGSQNEYRRESAPTRSEPSRSYEPSRSSSSSSSSSGGGSSSGSGRRGRN